MKRIISIITFLLAFAIGIFAGSYTIKFNSTDGADSNTATSSMGDIIADGSDYVSSISSASYIYKGKSGYGIKIGSSKNEGSLTLALSSAGQVIPTSVIVKSAQYGSDAGTLSVTLNSTSNTGLAPADGTLTLSSLPTEALTTITLAVSTKRAYVISITVNYEGGDDDEPTVLPVYRDTTSLASVCDTIDGRAAGTYISIKDTTITTTDTTIHYTKQIVEHCVDKTGLCDWILTLIPSDFKGDGYAVNDGTHTHAVYSDSETDSVQYTSSNVMLSSKKIQFKKTSGYLDFSSVSPDSIVIYNNTNLSISGSQVKATSTGTGTADSIKVYYTASCDPTHKINTCPAVKSVLRYTTICDTLTSLSVGSHETGRDTIKNICDEDSIINIHITKVIQCSVIDPCSEFSFNLHFNPYTKDGVAVTDADGTLYYGQEVSTADNTKAIMVNSDVVFSENANLVNIDSLLKVFPARDGYGCKIGSKAYGAVDGLALTLANGAYFDKIVISAAPYNSKSKGFLMITDHDTTIERFHSTTAGNFEEFTYENPTKRIQHVKMYEYDTTGNDVRFYVNEIRFEGGRYEDFVINSDTVVTTNITVKSITLNSGSLTIAPTGGITVLCDGVTGLNQDNFTIQSDRTNQGYFIVGNDKQMPTAKVIFNCNGTLDTGPYERATMDYCSIPFETYTYVNGHDSAYVQTWIYRFTPIPVDGSSYDKCINIQRGYCSRPTKTYWDCLMCTEYTGHFNSSFSSVLNKWEAYSISGYQNRYEMSLTGQLLNEDKTFVNSLHDTIIDENLVGNSYIAPIDLKSFTEDDFTGNADKTIYLYNSGSYVQTIAQTGVSVNSRGTAGQWTAIPVLASKDLPQGYATCIPAFDAFYISFDTTASMNGSIKLNYKKHVVNANYRDESHTRNYAPSRYAETPLRRVGMTIGTDNAVILERNYFTHGYDNGYDAFKVDFDTTLNSIYVRDNRKRYSVCARPEIDSSLIILNFHTDTIQLEVFDLIGQNLFFYDLQDSIYTPIHVKGNDSISYNTKLTLPKRGKTTDARLLIIDGNLHTIPGYENNMDYYDYNIENNTQNDIPTSNKDIKQNSNIEKFIYKNNLYIKKGNDIYNILGTKIN